MTDTKKCGTCGEVKLFTEFHKRAQFNKVHSHCKVCSSIKAREKAAVKRAARTQLYRKTSAKDEAALFNSINVRW